MILKSLDNFTGNGVLKGTIVAYDDAGEPLGWELYGNWSSQKFREKAAKDLSEGTGISLEKANAMIAQISKVARKDMDSSRERNGEE